MLLFLSCIQRLASHLSIDWFVSVGFLNLHHLGAAELLVVGVPSPNGLYFFSVLGQPIASKQHVYEHQKTPSHEGNAEDLVPIEVLVEPHVIDLQSEEVVDGSVASVRWEAASRQLGDACAREEHQNDVEEEAVHPGFVGLHRVEPDDEGNSQSELDIALDDRPDQVQNEVGVYNSRKESRFGPFEVDQQLVEEGDQRSVVLAGEVAEDQLQNP